MSDAMKREMHPDVYDYLELAALAFGGIGRGVFYDRTEFGTVDENCPVCAHGFGFVAEEGNLIGETEVTQELSRLGIKYSTNDVAVREINERLGRDTYTRVTWPQYTKQLGIVRAEVTNA